MGNRGGLKELIKKLALEAGCSDCGVAPADTPADQSGLLSWMNLGVPPGLAYMAKPARTGIKNWFPEARAVLLCSFQYSNSGMPDGRFTDRDALLEFSKKTGRPLNLSLLEKTAGPWKIARYALLKDYHEMIRPVLKRLLGEIAGILPGVKGRIFVDTSPVMEKPLARRAGLGWQGRNTLLISPENGSYFFLGGLALSAGLPADSPLENGCGNCDLCVKACPTGALNTPGILNAQLCLSYWTTQHKWEIPGRVIDKLGGNILGCDACQEACPRNKGVKTPLSKDFRHGAQ